jgi:hypothetical protein
MQNLAHSASFESLDKDAPSKAETKQLASWRCASISQVGPFQRSTFHPLSGLERNGVAGNRAAPRRAMGKPSAGTRPDDMSRLLKSREHLVFSPRVAAIFHGAVNAMAGSPIEICWEIHTL